MNNIDVVTDKWLVDLATTKGLAWRLWESDRDGLIEKLKSMESSGITDAMLQYAEVSALPEMLKDPLLKEVYKIKMFKNIDLKDFSKQSKRLGEIKNDIVMQEMSVSMFASLAKNIGK